MKAQTRPWCGDSSGSPRPDSAGQVMPGQVVLTLTEYTYGHRGRSGGSEHDSFFLLFPRDAYCTCHTLQNDPLPSRCKRLHLTAARHQRIEGSNSVSQLALAALPVQARPRAARELTGPALPTTRAACRKQNGHKARASSRIHTCPASPCRSDAVSYFGALFTAGCARAHARAACRPAASRPR